MSSPEAQHLDRQLDLPASKDRGQAGAQAQGTHQPGQGLTMHRFFTTQGVHPFEEIDWERRTAQITSEKDEVIFEQRDVEVPKFWSALATNVVAQKYFTGQLGTPRREASVKQLITRVAKTMADWGRKDGYFATPEDADIFEAELTHLLVNQKLAFNSPVWFNVGVEAKPQCSACFIQSIKDDMESILNLAKHEGMLFKWGSGTGTNLSPLRGSKERLSRGGWASGPVSFMRGYDAFAGVIKSGGKTRRAAKMVVLNIDHPDIMDFIKCKAEEEKKAWTLIEAGYDGGFNVPGGAYDSIQFQNANHSVRVTDDFMRAVLDDKEWHARGVKSGDVMGTYKARELMREIAEAAWICGDPGIQFDTTTNHWHTSPNSGRINASNPCSEYVFLDDTACNLSSLNLMKFRRPDGEFDAEAFSHAVRVTISAMEIVVDNASYPTPPITEKSHMFRTLGIGYANLGALLMARGIPYDSDAGRDYAAAITALLTGQGYWASAEIAKQQCGGVGPFPGYPENREPMLRVIQQHRAALNKVNPKNVPEDLWEAVNRAWQEAYTTGLDYGYRNAQISVIAPTGTIAFMMDCDTTGVEPDLALIKYKMLVGGGVLKIVNRTVPEALKRLGYSDDQVQAILAYLDEKETIEGAPHLKDEHLPVFDCAFKPLHGARSIQYMGHVRMMAAVQPFISGAISKTVNMPTEVAPEDIQQAYIEAWKMGLKAIAIYRDGSKRTQPLSTGKKKEGAEFKPVRHRLQDERKSITHKFSVGGHEGYITVGMYEDGQPGEIFITMAKEGTVVSGLIDAFATAVSLALQFGVPLKILVDKFSHTRFEPYGVTNNPQIRFAKSILDYIFRWLALKFLSPEEQAQYLSVVAEPTPKTAPGMSEAARTEIERHEKQIFQAQADAPPCPDCGAIMVRNGACYKCLNCGATSGCS